MITYMVLNLIVILLITSFLYSHPAIINKRAVLITLGVLIIITAIFDSIMIAIGLFGYNSKLIIGLYLGRAPIEDFAYPIIAAVCVPYVWEKLGKNRHGTM